MFPVLIFVAVVALALADDLEPHEHEHEPFYCYGKAPGFYTVPDCCSEFWECDGTEEDGQVETHPLDCPAGLVFNESLQACVFPSQNPECSSLECEEYHEE